MFLGTRISLPNQSIFHVFIITHEHGPYANIMPLTAVLHFTIAAILATVQTNKLDLIDYNMQRGPLLEEMDHIYSSM